MNNVTRFKKDRKPTLDDLEDFPHDGIHTHCARLAAYLKSRDCPDREAVRLIHSKFASRTQRRQLQRGEVERAVASVYGGVLRKPMSRVGKLFYKPKHKSGKWPSRMPMPESVKDATVIKRALELTQPWALDDMWEQSPIRADELTPIQILEMLYEPNELLCCGSVRSFKALTLNQWKNSQALMGEQVVPSPNATKTGQTKNLRRSSHCRDATGARRYLVVESDDPDLTFDQKATLLRFLRDKAKADLRMVVHTAGKSLHGWFKASEEEKVNWEFMRLACRIGADPRMWLPEQFARLPNAIRSKYGLVQKCFYLDAR